MSCFGFLTRNDLFRGQHSFILVWCILSFGSMSRIGRSGSGSVVASRTMLARCRRRRCGITRRLDRLRAHLLQPGRTMVLAGRSRSLRRGRFALAACGSLFATQSDHALQR